MHSIRRRIEDLEKVQPRTEFDPTRPLVIILYADDPDPQPTDGPGPLILRRSGERPLSA